ncbi:hypothetical protein HK105_200213 [Polyrhizophydium stewartii]|uniref:Uncharacterized protein n=1 Tax=Polyrhizophydium stewartii TaxID=2732419 RepID=A0ABR4NKU3_9FUNG|nr:hypothetical protein HK105_006067 [Polyrhizophydium stewartii]
MDAVEMLHLEKVAQRLVAVQRHPRVAKLLLDEFVREAGEEERGRAAELARTAPTTVQRVHRGAVALGIARFCKFYHVESDYYNWSLEHRAARLAAPSIDHLCKTVVFENTRWKDDGLDVYDMRFARFYAVIVQYTDKINPAKLNQFAWGELGGQKRSKRDYNLRVAEEPVALALTGLGRMGVVPIGAGIVGSDGAVASDGGRAADNGADPASIAGLRTPALQMSVILTSNVVALAPRIMFLGAGHIDWKIAVPIDVFRRNTACVVADLA